MLDGHVSYHSEISTSGLVEIAAESSSKPILVAKVVCTGNLRILMRQLKGPLFGVDYLDSNKIMEKELMEYCAKY